MFQNSSYVKQVGRVLHVIHYLGVWIGNNAP
jgi:hypothetical protein